MAFGASRPFPCARGRCVEGYRERALSSVAVSIYFADATLASAFVPAGAPPPRSRRSAACSRCAKTSRHRGLGRGCIGRLDRRTHLVRVCCERKARRRPLRSCRKDPIAALETRNARCWTGPRRDFRDHRADRRARRRAEAELAASRSGRRPKYRARVGRRPFRRAARGD